MAAEFLLEAGLGRPPADHAVGIDAVHGFAVELAGFATRRAEEGVFAVIADPGGSEVLIDEGLELVMRWHLVTLATFLVEANLPSG